MQLIEKLQFDTIYHEHFSYLSLGTVSQIFSAFGLRVWDVDELETHGGSLRVYACHNDDARGTELSVTAILTDELQKGLRDLGTYESFQSKANAVKNDFIRFLIDKKRLNKRVAAYGAAAKGNTLLNYAGIKSDLLEFVCDAAPAKQGKFLPGSHLPILAPEAMDTLRPDYIVILPWNIAPEVMKANARSATLGSKFVTVIPSLVVR